MFNGNKILVKGEHAEMLDALMYANGGIFSRMFDIFMCGASIGLVEGVREKEVKAEVKPKTIFEETVIANRHDIEFASKTIILADKDIEEVDKIDRALRNFNTDENVKSKNKELIIEYAYGGIRILNKALKEGQKNNLSRIEIIRELMDKYYNYDLGIDMDEEIIDMVKKNEA